MRMRIDFKYRWWLIVAVLAFALRAPAIHDRFYSNDEATYSALATKLLSGGSMYVDAVDHKPPGIAWLYAGIYGISAPYRLQDIRILFVVLVALTGILVGELTVGLTGDARARVAGVLYVLLTVTGLAPNTQAANTELVLNAALALAAAAMVAHSREGRWTRGLLWAIAAGAATGIASLFKYQAAMAGVAWLVWLGIGRPRTHPAVGACGLAIGFAVVAAALAGWFARAGHLDAFLFWGWRYNFQYIAAVPLLHQIERFVTETAPIAAVWSPTIVLAAAARRRLAFAWLWAAAMAVAVSIGGRFFGNYFLMLTPPAAMLAASGLLMLYDSARRRQAVWLAASAVGLALGSVAAAANWQRLDPESGRIDDRYRQAGAWIQSHSRPGDRLLVWGDSAQIYVYSRRVMGTRFAFCNYHTGIIWGTSATPGGLADAVPSAVVPRAWSELLDDMRRAPPAFVADAAAAGLHNFEGQALERFPELWSIIDTQYRYETTVAGIPIYRRIDRT
jgi:4-amino-4-deoxy-L-arabinose transferase-like glycosyltransferase